ncbi:MAG: hypothetical protein A2Z47_03780 [Thermodesulfovibrio sp. RBG_19FT_COMBO_42_12]|nr:MAG: hypothetical protein A2Z47_03780 [Thermodesulfovibrio sp. RBG_19FT_COMBO_42_12]
MNSKQKFLKLNSIILAIGIIVSLSLIIYGGVFSKQKIYEGSKINQKELPFYDWYKETEVISATTFGGIRRGTDNKFFTVYKDRLRAEKKLWSFCPS